MKMKLTIINQLAIALMLVMADAQMSTTLAQGSLTPPGTPAPAMKSLAQIEPRTPISSTPFVITNPGSYYLTTNLVGLSGTNGIVIASGDVTVDLNGFALIGVPGSLEGIYYSGNVTNITIKNGSVRGWGASGINGTGFFYNGLVERVKASDNGSYGILVSDSVIRDCVADNNQSQGIYGTFGVITGCTARQNKSIGIYMLYGLISDCTATGNGSAGIFGFDSCIRNCTANNNDTIGASSTSAGIEADEGCLVIGCVANLNGSGTNGVGILSTSSTINTTNVTIQNCSVSANQNDGIRAIGPANIINNTANDNGRGWPFSAGIHTTGSGSVIQGNRVRGNHNSGIRSDGGVGADVIINNSAGNNSTNYFPTSGATFAPIQSPATMTNAWGNIVF
jgi:hypothetical protein